MLKFQVKLNIESTKTDLEKAILKELHVKDLPQYKIAKRSIDAREKDNILYIYSIECDLGKKEEGIIRSSKGRIAKSDSATYHFDPTGTEQLSKRPVIIGAGPAGLFAGYMLAKAGFCPIILERGQSVEQRDNSRMCLPSMC